MNSIDKKELIEAIRTNKKIKDKHINYLFQKIIEAKLEDKIIKSNK